jgi:O-acetyl-ADP-ribose deacetylase (regulator of RNase III)
MIKFVHGNLLDATENIICHQVNCQGVMGSGLAKQIRDKYPSVYLKYNSFCNGKSPKELLGQMQIVQLSGDKGVANLFGQLNYGRDKSVIYTDYHALHNSFLQLKDFAEFRELSVAIPYNIGCGLANGDWNVVRGIIETTFKDCDYVTIYKYE